MPAAEAITLLSQTGIGASGAGEAVAALGRYGALFGVMNVTAVPTGGAPTLNVYVQATPDGGTTWQDVASFQFTGSAAKRVFALAALVTPGTSLLATSDGALASGTQVQGPYGDRLRVKYVFAAGGSTGTYSLTVSVTPSGGP